MKIYLWKLGSLEHKMLPKREAIHAFAELIIKWNGKEDLHLVWGPDI